MSAKISRIHTGLALGLEDEGQGVRGGVVREGVRLMRKLPIRTGVGGDALSIFTRRGLW